MKSVSVSFRVAPRGRAAFFDRSKLIIAFFALGDDSGDGFRVGKPRTYSDVSIHVCLSPFLFSHN
jgi:hypothetical protein